MEMSTDGWDPSEVRARIVPGPLPPRGPEVRLDHKEIVEGDYSGLRLEYFSAYGCRFERCCFDGVKFDMMGVGAGMEQSVYVDCSFDQARLRMHPGGFARFERCTFSNVNIREWRVNPCDLIDCLFTGTIRKSMFYGQLDSEIRRERFRDAGIEVVNKIYGNDFSGAKLLDVSFRGGVDLRLQRLPEGPDYLYIDI